MSNHPDPSRVDAAGSRVIGSRRLAASLSRHHLGRLDAPHFLDRLVWLGSPISVVALAVALAVLAFVWRDRFGMVLAGAGPLVAELLTEQVLKPLVHRQLPSGINSFPSGHATGITAIVAVLLVLLYRRHGGVLALRALPVLTVVVAVVGVAIVRLHYHYLTDVVGGVGVGAAAVLALTSAAMALNSRAIRSDA